MRAMARERRSRERRERVLRTKELLEAGKSPEQIANELGVSSATVKTYIKEAKSLNDSHVAQIKEEAKRSTSCCGTTFVIVLILLVALLI